MYKRTLAFLLALCMIVGVFPVTTLAAETEDATQLGSFQVTYINPLYADVVTEADLNTVSAYSIVKDDVAYNVSIEEAGDYLRPLLVERNESITVGYTTDTFENTQAAADALALEVFNAAIAHTGDPEEGDYLKWQHGGWTCGVTGKVENGVYYLTLSYDLTYYTDASQEAAVKDAANDLLDELIVSGMTDYQKVKAIYDWICENVTYDYANLDDDSYKLKFTAYGALVDKTAVCQGYALLLYRLALELGIDCRLIPGEASGEAHGWNIVELGDVYYNADTTWDAGETEYTCFLKCDAEFTGHTRDEEYASETFNQAYPMSQTSYVPTAEDEAEPDGSSGSGNIEDGNKNRVVWTLNDGVMTISGSGPMDDYAKNTDTPWYKYADSITSVVIEEGITRIGSNAFAQCANLTGIQIAESVTSIGEYALASSGLTGVTFPETLTELGSNAFQGCASLTSVTIPASITKVSDMAFEGCTALTEVTLPEGLTDLGKKSFANCTALAKLDFPATLTTIDSQALMGCTGLTEMYFVGDAPGFIGSEAFINVTATAYYPAGNTTWTDSVRQNYGGTITWVYYCPNGHDYVPEERTATCTEVGGTYYICSACGDTFVQNEVAALGHDYVDHVCTRCGDVEKVLPAPVAAVENITSSGKIRITWEAVEGAASYNVYYSTEKYDNYTLLKNTTGTKLNHTSAVTGTTYYYCVTSIDENGKEFGTDFPEENILSATCKLARPTVTLGNKASTGKITISWEAVEGAVGYEIYRSTDGGENYSRLSSTTDKTSITNTSSEAGKKYYYQVKALAENTTADSALSSAKGRVCDLPRPTVTLGNKASTGKVTIKWEPVEGAVKYRVYRSADGGENYEQLTVTSKTSVTNTSAEAGVKYYYQVVAVAENTSANSAYSSAKARVCDLPQPTVTLSNKLSSGKITISWEAVEGAVKYKVYRSTDGENYEYLSSTAKTSMTNTSAEAGKTYYYQVKAVPENTSGTSAYSEPVSGVCKLPRPEVSITLDSSGKPVVTWDAVDGAVKYEVYYHNDATSKYQLLTTTTATGINHVGAKAGETCYYRVVALAPDASWNSARSAEVFIPCVSVDITGSELMEAVVDRINEYREYNGVEALEWYTDGVTAAQIRAAELTVKMDTTRPDGGSCEELLELYDLYYEVDLQAEPKATAEEIVDALMSDEDAATICMYEEFTYAVAARNSDCWVIMFGGDNL